MLNSLLAGVTSFVISLAFLPFIIRFSKKKEIGALPGRRKIHKKITPSLGGVAIFLGFTVACIVWSINPRSSVIFLVLPILIIPFVIGLFDDLIHLTPLAKLIAQVLTATLIFFILDVRLTSFYGLFPEVQFSPLISFLVTLLTIVLITNSLNLIDGIDGLAAVLSVISTLAFGEWFLLNSNYPYSIICFSLTGGILAFLFQNWEPSKIFMGDTGSLVIGTILSIICIAFINKNHALEASNSLKFGSSIGAAISCIIVPLIDTIRVTVIRISKGISPFKADKRHVHHNLIRLGLAHRQIVYVLALIQIVFIVLAIALRKAAEPYLLTSALVMSILLSIILNLLVRRQYSRLQKEAN